MACASYQTHYGESQSILQKKRIARGKLVDLNGSKGVDRLETAVEEICAVRPLHQTQVKGTARIVPGSRTPGWLLVATVTSGREGT